jgi:hypothetical protein
MSLLLRKVFEQVKSTIYTHKLSINQSFVNYINLIKYAKMKITKKDKDGYRRSARNAISVAGGPRRRFM